MSWSESVMTVDATNSDAARRNLCKKGPSLAACAGQVLAEMKAEMKTDKLDGSFAKTSVTHFLSGAALRS